MRSMRRLSFGITPCAVIWAAVLAVGVVGCKANQVRQPAGGEAIAKVLPSTGGAGGSPGRGCTERPRPERLLGSRSETP